MSMVRIACAQLALAVGELPDNRALSCRAVSRACAAGSGLVVLPELCNSGYVFADPAEAARCSEALDGPTVSAWQRLSAEHGIVIVGGLCERLGDGSEQLANSAVVLDRGALLGVYRKGHLWDRESLFFCPGEREAPVLDTSAGRIGVAICYDTFFPEVARSLALRGAEILIAPMNNPVLEPVLTPLAAELALGMTSAMVNRIFVAQCDRAGEERGIRWVGATAVFDPDGRRLTKPAVGDDLLVADIDPSAARVKRVGDRNDVLGDRRPELYRATPAPR